MKRLLVCLILFALSPALQAQDGSEGRHRGNGQPASRNSYANPSAAIAAELAFSRLAAEKGRWTAFRATAAPDAVMFAPAMVLAQSWLKDHPNPAGVLTWQPHQVWSSCDGSLMVTTGAWQDSGSPANGGAGNQGKGGSGHGWFTTVWARQDKGEYKWVFDHGADSAEPLQAPDMIAAKVADCPDRPAAAPGRAPHRGRAGPAQKPVKAPPAPPFNPLLREGRSRDGTLTWRVTADAAGNHEFTARLLVDGIVQDVRSERIAAVSR